MFLSLKDPAEGVSGAAEDVVKLLSPRMMIIKGSHPGKTLIAGVPGQLMVPETKNRRRDWFPKKIMLPLIPSKRHVPLRNWAAGSLTGGIGPAPG
jgi:hypothetical protein